VISSSEDSFPFELLELVEEKERVEIGEWNDRERGRRWCSSGWERRWVVGMGTVAVVVGIDGVVEGVFWIVEVVEEDLVDLDLE